MTKLTENVFAVEVPEDVEGCEIRGEHPGGPYQLLSFYGEAEAIDLPPGTWQILCTTREATHGQIQDIIDWQFESAVRIGFRNYLGGESDYSCRYSSESLNSLLTSKGLDVNKYYVLLKKEKP